MTGNPGELEPKHETTEADQGIEIERGGGAVGVDAAAPLVTGHPPTLLRDFASLHLHLLSSQLEDISARPYTSAVSLNAREVVSPSWAHPSLDKPIDTPPPPVISKTYCSRTLGYEVPDEREREKEREHQSKKPIWADN